MKWNYIISGPSHSILGEDLKDTLLQYSSDKETTMQGIKNGTITIHKICKPFSKKFALAQLQPTPKCLNPETVNITTQFMESVV